MAAAARRMHAAARHRARRSRRRRRRISQHPRPRLRRRRRAAASQPWVTTFASFHLSSLVATSSPTDALIGVFVSLRAGKVHGSLARAGKVRGQTPKVAKQDKKKKPRGRAHKRMQYNRRFVTAVVGFGKKRGPNSSEK
uniref:Uncharacterized protein n=1 Tax=Setaria italica TaxID=4555 RepID=K3Y2S3_SETIT